MYRGYLDVKAQPVLLEVSRVSPKLLVHSWRLRGRHAVDETVLNKARINVK